MSCRMVQNFHLYFRLSGLFENRAAILRLLGPCFVSDLLEELGRKKKKNEIIFNPLVPKDFLEGKGYKKQTILHSLRSGVKTEVFDRKHEVLFFCLTKSKNLLRTNCVFVCLLISKRFQKIPFKRCSLL